MDFNQKDTHDYFRGLKAGRKQEMKETMVKEQKEELKTLWQKTRKPK